MANWSGFEGVYTQVTGWSTALASVGADGSSQSGNIDTDGCFSVSLKVTVNGDNASSDGVLEVSGIWDEDTSVPTDSANAIVIGFVSFDGTDDHHKMLIVPPDQIHGRYLNLYVVNTDATYGLGANTDIEYKLITTE